MTNQEQQIIEAFGVSLLEFEIFMEGISGLFRKHPKISLGSFPVVHSVKSRIKSNDHLLDKIQRKNGEGRNFCQLLSRNNGFCWSPYPTLEVDPGAGTRDRRS